MNERPVARWIEISLLASLICLAGFAGFMLGRLTAPDAGVAFERGHSVGRAAERLRGNQNRIESEILKQELAAARSHSKESPKSGVGASTSGERARETETVTGANH
jgi:hypothetical protein